MNSSDKTNKKIPGYPRDFLVRCQQKSYDAHAALGQQHGCRRFGREMAQPQGCNPSRQRAFAFTKKSPLMPGIFLCGIQLPKKKSMMLSQMMSMNTFLNSQRIPRRIARIASTIKRNTAMMASRMALRMDMVISCICYFFTVMLYPLFARISGGFCCCHTRQKGGCNLLESWKRLQP